MAVVAASKWSKNEGSINDEAIPYLRHKMSKNKWKSKQVGKECRNRQSRSNRNNRHHRQKRYYHQSNIARKGIISSYDSKNLKHKRRLTNDSFISDSMVNDIYNFNQSNLEETINLDHDYDYMNPELLIHASPKRRRRGKKQLKQINNNDKQQYQTLGLSSNYSSITDDDYLSPSPISSPIAMPPMPVPVPPVPVVPVIPEVVNQFPDFKIEEEMKSLGLEMVEDGKEKTQEEKEMEMKEIGRLEEEYRNEINKIDELNEYAAIEGLALRSSFKQYNIENETTKMDPKTLKKVFKEIKIELPKNIVIQWNGSMFIRFDEENPRFLQALLTGLDDTPYENGLFLFDIYLHKDYPNSPLNIKHITKGGNLVRGNHTPGGYSPNLHRGSGKVCLSLLGTWGTNQWDPKTSNIYQVLSSILFWIFGAKWAYYMEPGHGGWELTAPMTENDFTKHSKDVISYNYEIIEKCMKYAILDTIRTPYIGFNDIIKAHFKIKKNIILKTILTQWIKNAPSIEVKNKLIPLYNEIKQELNKL